MRKLVLLLCVSSLVACSGNSEKSAESDDPRESLSWEAKSCDHAVVRLETDRLLNGENAREKAHETLKEKCLIVPDADLIKLFSLKLADHVAPSTIITSSEVVSPDKMTVTGLLNFVSSDGTPSDRDIRFTVSIDPLKGWDVDVIR